MSDINSNNNNLPRLTLVPGAVNLDFQYERVLVSHVSVKCCLRRDLLDFNLALNAKEHKNLDVVIHIYYRDGSTEVLLCQIKHKDNKGHLKDFLNLDKYENSYKTLQNLYGNSVKITLVLFTNSFKCHPPNVEARSIVFEEDNILSIFNTNMKKGECYQLVKNGDESTFYKNCYLFCNQIRATNGNNLILNDLGGSFTVDQVQAIDNYFQKNIPKRKNPFSKCEIEFMLCDILMNPFVLEFNTTDDFKNKPITDELFIVLKIFNLSNISKENLRYLVKYVNDFIENKLKVSLTDLQWNKELPKDIVDRLIQVNQKYIKTRIAYKPLMKKDLWLLMWIFGELPLLLNINSSNYQQVDFFLKYLSKELSVVLCDEENLLSNPPKDLKVFNQLNDIKSNDNNNKLVEEILEKANIRLQFNSLPLKQIAIHHEDILKNVGLDALIEMFCNDFPNNDTPSNYVKRDFKIKFYTKDVVQCSEFHSFVEDSFLKPHFDFDLQDNCSKYATGKIASGQYCIFKNIEDKYFLYSKNLKQPEMIEKYAKYEQINETDFLTYKVDRIIIHGPAGIGKTTFLKNLSASSTCTKLYIYISNDLINSVNDTLFTDNKTLSKFILKTLNYTEKNHLEPFMSNFLFASLEKKRVHLLIDCVDKTKVNPVFFYKLSMLDVPLILATRSDKITEVGNVFKKALVFELIKFHQDKQLDFIRNSFGGNIDAEKIIKTIVKKFPKTTTLNMLGNPRVVKTITETCLEIKDNVGHWNLINLGEFIDKQMEAYPTKQMRRSIRQLACQLFFKDDILKELSINPHDLSEDLEDIQYYNINDTIISSVNTSNGIQFTHPIYAEFLCAQYLCQMFTVETGELKKYSKIVELMFAEDLIQIRLFLDLLLSKEKPLFIAVLLDDRQKVDDILKNNKKCLSDCDKLGRTIIHVMMGYGVRYNYPYKVEGLKHISKLTRYNLFEQAKGLLISTDIFYALLQYGKEYGKEVVYNKDSFGNHPEIYGFYSRSYEFLNLFCNFNNLSCIPDINQNIFFIYLIVNYNFGHLFEKCLDLEPFANMNWEIDARGRNSIIHFFNNYNTIFNSFNIYMISELIDYDNFTILHLASKKNLLDMAIIIVSRKLVSIKCVDYMKMTPLDYAQQSNNQKMISLLRTQETTSKYNSADLENSSKYLTYPKCLDQFALEELLKENKLNLHSKIRSLSPVYKAILDSDLESLKLLVKYNANLFMTFNGFSILEIAAQHATTEVLKFLIQEQEQCDIDKLQLLYSSITGMNINNIKYLLTYKMDIIKIIEEKNKTVMHLAAQLGDSGVIKLLLEKGGGINALDSYNRTPIFFAIESKNYETLECLIEEGADLNHKAYNNFGVMHAAALYGNPKIIKTLLDKSCNIEDLNNENKTPLFFTVRGNKLDNFKFLINEKANLRHRTINNASIMHIAAQLGNKNFIEILINNGCEIDDLDDDGKTPIFYSIEENNLVTFNFLIEKGANLTHKSKHHSVLKFAETYGKSEMIDILKKLVASKNMKHMKPKNNRSIKLFRKSINMNH